MKHESVYASVSNTTIGGAVSSKTQLTPPLRGFTTIGSGARSACFAFLLVLVSLLFVVGFAPQAAYAETGGFAVTGGTEGVDYEYKEVTYNLQQQNTPGTKYRDLAPVNVNALVVKTSEPLTISTTSETSDCIYITPGVTANLTFDNVVIKGTFPVNIPTSSTGAPTKLNLTLAKNSTNSLTTWPETGRYPGIRCGEGSYLVIDDDIVNVDSAGTEIVVEGGRVARDAQLQNGTLVKQGDRATVLDSSNPGKISIYGGYDAAAIGSGDLENAGDITINGGVITARAYGHSATFVGSGVKYAYGTGAGIGAGLGGNGTKITINGGTIDARGSNHGAGIGGGTWYGTSSSWHWSYGGAYVLTDAKINTENYGSPVAGDIIINGGYVKSEGGAHGNAFGGACGSTLKGCKIVITGGTLLPTSYGDNKDIGGADGDVYVTGGSVRVASESKFQSSTGNFAWGDTDKQTKVYMRKIDLSGYGTMANSLVDSLSMSTGGLPANFGMPSYTDENACLYLWLPNSTAGDDVDVHLEMKNNKGEDVTDLANFVLKSNQTGELLKQYAPFKTITSTGASDPKLTKIYDGAAFNENDIEALKTAIFGGNGIPVQNPPANETDHPNGYFLQNTNSSVMTVKAQRWDPENNQPVSGEAIETIENQVAVGSYRLEITSTEFSNVAGFSNSFWGHRGYYEYAEILPAPSQASVEVTGEDASLNAVLSVGKSITLNATVAPQSNAGVSQNVKAPKGKVQFYLNGKPLGEPVDLNTATEEAADPANPSQTITQNKKNASGYEYATASMTYTLKKSDIDLLSDAENQEITVEYVGGEDCNYGPSNANPGASGDTTQPASSDNPVSSTPQTIKVEKVSQGDTPDDEHKTNPIKISIDQGNGEAETPLNVPAPTKDNPTPSVNDTKTYGDSFTLKPTGGDTNNNFTYTSSNPDVAEIDENGKVTIKGVPDNPSEKVVITITRPGNAAYNAASVEVNLEIHKKELTIKSTKVENKTYDGTTDAIIAEGGIEIEGITAADKQKARQEHAISAKAAFPSEQPGDYNNTKVSVSLSDELSKYYYFKDANNKETSSTEVTAIASITKRTHEPTTITTHPNKSISVVPTDTLASDTGANKPTYTSSDPSVATVDENGQVIILKEGKATITTTLPSDGSVSITEITSTKTDINNNSNITITPANSTTPLQQGEEPSVVVNDTEENKTLEEGKDYCVVSKEKIDDTTWKITIEGTGDAYTGTRTETITVSSEEVLPEPADPTEPANPTKPADPENYDRASQASSAGKTSSVTTTTTTTATTAEEDKNATAKTGDSPAPYALGALVLGAAVTLVVARRRMVR